MPDSDIVRKKLAGRYVTAYKQLCEGQASPESIARRIVAPMRRTLSKETGLPETIRALCNELAKRRVSSPQLYPAGDKILSQTGKDLSKPVRAILKDVFIQYVQAARERVPFSPVSFCRAFYERDFNVEFASPVIGNSGEDHHADADPIEVESKVPEVRNCVMREFEWDIRQIIGTSKPIAIRIPNQGTKVPISSETDFLTLLMNANETKIQPELPF